MYWKRWNLFASLLALSLLAGCAAPGGTQDTPPEKPVVVTVWNYYNGPQQDTFNDLVWEFNETVGQEQKIVVETVSKGTIDGLIQAVMESAEGSVGSESLPQLCAAYPDTALSLDRLGLLADIRPYLTAEELDVYVDAYLKEGLFSSDNALKLFPVAKSTEVLTINLTAWEPFAQATGAELDALSTWEGVAEVAAQYYQWTDAQTPAPEDGRAFFGRDALANHLLAGSSQLGHDVLQVVDGALVLDFDRSAMEQLWNSYYLPFVKGHYIADGKFRSDDMNMGTLIAYVGSTSGALYTPKRVIYEDGTSQDIQCAVLPVPNFADTQPTAVQQGGGMALFQGDRRTEQAAVEFLKWFTQPENNVRFCMGSGYLPVRKDANRMEVLDQVIAQHGDTPKILRDNLLIGMEEVNQYSLYTTQPSLYATDVRSVLADSLTEYAATDRETVKGLIRGGLSTEDAVARLDPERRFSQWYEETGTTLKGFYIAEQ